MRQASRRDRESARFSDVARLTRLGTAIGLSDTCRRGGVGRTPAGEEDVPRSVLPVTRPDRRADHGHEGGATERTFEQQHVPEPRQPSEDDGRVERRRRAADHDDGNPTTPAVWPSTPSGPARRARRSPPGRSRALPLRPPASRRPPPGRGRSRRRSLTRAARNGRASRRARSARGGGRARAHRRTGVDDEVVRYPLRAAPRGHYSALCGGSAFAQ